MSGSNVKNAIVLLSVLLLAAHLIAGCGGSKSQNGDGPGEVQRDVVVEGTVSLRGSTPFTLLLLEGKDGKNYMIESSRVVEELKRLEGMDVVVTAKVLPQVQGEAPALSVRDYDMLPFPTGERPVVGVLYAQPPDLVYLHAKDGTTWSIKGDFQSVLVAYSGSKVWVAGDRMQPSATMDRSVKEILVTQYGIIVE